MWQLSFNFVSFLFPIVVIFLPIVKIIDKYLSLVNNLKVLTFYGNSYKIKIQF